MPHYCHLHNHSQYSLLDGHSSIEAMIGKAKADGQVAVALTDHGNMFGAFKFVAEAEKQGVKPIVGCEFYIVPDRHKHSFVRSQGERDERYHQLLMAKNKKGYENLSKLASLGFMEGLYGKYPRIDKEILKKHSEGVIATSCCIGAEIPQAIIKGQLDKAEELIKWYYDIFGEDFYIEIQRQGGLENIDGLGISQEDVNQKLIEYAKKYNLKVIATNDSHYIDEDDWLPHDILLSINTGSILGDPKRFRFPSNDYYFKTQAEMNQVFADIPEALDNTLEIADKVEHIKLANDILLPAFPLPKGFNNQDEYLRHLTFTGAKKFYGQITPAIEERLNFELKVIKESGYPGYFLIVYDFISTARKMGVAVGPGRGSAAGSAVAYCLEITRVDPIKYDLLFERFLNPERISMPDIDIDFDDEGRQKVLDYVIEKYGKNQVAQIITYGSMAAKSSIRDVGRVLDVPLQEVDKIAKTFPNQLGATLKDILAKGDITPKLKDKLNAEDMEKAYKFRQMAAGDDKIAETINTALRLEGSIRNTGTHACGVVITPTDITDIVPVKTDKGSDMLITQFDNSVAEDAGLLKMDFLGLKTLSIIKSAVNIIKTTKGVDIDIESVDLTDAKTYEIFQKGDTIGIFQYESTGMQRYLKELKPNKFEDVIAMNALYRPGPLSYIPNFIARKHGKEKIIYDLPEMEEYLAETYGITVYQEQVMLLSQKLGGFSKGQADQLRKAMGKKKKKLVDELFPKFLEGCIANGHPEDKIRKIWHDWEAFTSYAFNKSHSTSYAMIAFWTAYLKAHFPAEFMAAVLTHNKNDITKLNLFLRECKRMELTVLGPDINESIGEFTVNDKGQIRFGLTALKGVGEGPVEAIIEERKNGHFVSIFDLTRRLHLQSVNKRVMEAMVLGGGFDSFGLHRSQYLAPSGKYPSLIDHALKYGNAYQAQKQQSVNSLFGDSEEIMIQEPEIPKTTPWSLIEKLTREKEVTGIFISGHPLDDYKLEVEHFTTCTLDEVEKYKNRKIKLAGFVTMAQHRISQKGTGWGIFTVQDYNGSLDFRLFKDSYQKFKNFLEVGQSLYIKGLFERRWDNEGYQFSVKEINLLESAAKDMKSITLKIPVTQMDELLFDELIKLFKERRGTHVLKIKLLDPLKKTSVAMYSGNTKVHVDTDFLWELEKLGIKYVIE